MTAGAAVERQPIERHCPAQDCVLGRGRTSCGLFSGDCRRAIGVCARLVNDGGDVRHALAALRAAPTTLENVGDRLRVFRRVGEFTIADGVAKAQIHGGGYPISFSVTPPITNKDEIKFQLHATAGSAFFCRQ